MLKKPSRWSWPELPDWRVVIRDWRFLGSVAVLAAVGIVRAALAPSREELAAEGRQLFVHEWTRFDELSGGGDGLGPVFNAASCLACHAQGGVGGAGGNEHNVTAYEVLPTRNDPSTHGGVVHARAVPGVEIETKRRLHELFPVVPGGVRVISGCTVNVADFDPVVFHQINTPALFGSGAIDQISGWAIRRQHLSRRAANAAQELGGNFKNTPAGRVRILPDGRVGKFGWKAQFATLEEFVATACAVELGLSNHIRKQDLPHEHRPDVDVMPDMTRRQLHSLVTFCALLEAPVRDRPGDPAVEAQARRGEELFTQVGCIDCHTPDIGGVTGVYSDFCLHRIIDPEDDPGYGSFPEVPLSEDVPAPDEWKTPPLWGVADTAPYLHDGSAATLEAAIEAHRGEARHVMNRYRETLNADDRAAIVAFLKTLRAPPQTAEPTTSLAAR